MDKRYQVFVSSTYEDLREERQEVMQALLELDCIPCGMELFPAANEDQWTLIKKVIDDCDYYLVIIGGRYGSVGPDGKSYTQMEYEYAVSRGKPVIAFHHSDPGLIPSGKVEQTEEGKKQLEQFRKLSKQKMVKYWKTPHDLGSVVSRSIVKLIKSNPAVGWVRADELVEGAAATELLRLRKQIEDLQARLERSSTDSPKGSEELASGDELFELVFNTSFEDVYEDYTSDVPLKLSWNTIFRIVAPFMIDKAPTAILSTALASHCRDKIEAAIRQDTPAAHDNSLRPTSGSLNTVIVQLRALGLFVRDERQRSVRDTSTYWTLTPYGDNVMTKAERDPRRPDISLKEMTPLWCPGVSRASGVWPRPLARVSRTRGQNSGTDGTLT